MKSSLQSVSQALLIASLRVRATSTSSLFQSSLVVSTTFILPGKGLSRDSYVFRPITTGIPQVLFLKNFRSLGKYQGILFFFPITLFSVAATTWDIII